MISLLFVCFKSNTDMTCLIHGSNQRSQAKRYGRLSEVQKITDSFFRVAAAEGFYMLVGGLEHQFYFPRNIGLLIIPIDVHIFQRGGPTTNQIWFYPYCIDLHPQKTARFMDLYSCWQARNACMRVARCGRATRSDRPESREGHGGRCPETSVVLINPIPRSY